MPSKTAWAFRPDIEGLRAIAVGAVLAFHSGLNVAGGGYVGVDVFFVISGFLITGLLLRELDATGTIHFPTFYARRARRLLPASVVALSGTALLSYLFLPINRWIEIGRDTAAAGLYFLNWRLAHRAIDYLSSENAASPIQHFWSLSIEEQFYFVWPVLILGSAVLTRSMGFQHRTVAATLIGGISVVSLLNSISRTNLEPSAAYFATSTRIWELGLGALLAVVVGRIPAVSKKLATTMAISGLGMIVLAVVTFTSETAFPGTAASLPTLGATMVILAGSLNPGHQMMGLLGNRAAIWLGARSYSLYLWHWPLVIVARELYGPSVIIGVGAVLASFVPAAASYRYVENPLRHWKRDENAGKSIAAGIVLTTVAVAAGLVLLSTAQPETQPEISAQPLAFLTSSEVPNQVPEALVPSLALVGDDRPVSYDSGCHVSHREPKPIRCDYGNLAGPTVVLVGDSHANQWLPALREIGDQEGWHIVSMTKSACPLLDTMFWNGVSSSLYSECAEWTTEAIRLITEDLEPSLVVLGSSITNRPVEAGARAEPKRAAELYEGALVRTINSITDAGLSVLIINDTPQPPQNIPECLASSGDIELCTFPIPLSRVDLESVSMTTSVPMLDMTPYICFEGHCPPVIGQYLVWRDGSHLSTPMTKALAPALREALSHAISP